MPRGWPHSSVRSSQSSSVSTVPGATNGRERPSDETGVAPASHARRRSSWIVEANAVCRLGRKLYPSIAREPTTAIPTRCTTPSTDSSARSAASPSPQLRPLVTPARTPRPSRRERVAVAATRPIGDVTIGEQREAERSAAADVDELVALGARACAPLRPVDDESSRVCHAPSRSGICRCLTAVDGLSRSEIGRRLQRVVSAFSSIHRCPVSKLRRVGPDG
jgi:hypothetical protein